MMMLILGALSGIITYICLKSPKTRKEALLFSVVVVLLVVCCYRNADSYDNTQNFSKEYQLMLAGNGFSLQDAKVREAETTVYENIGKWLVAICILVIMFAVATTEELTKDEARTIYKKVLVLLISMLMYMFSLLWGLKLTLLPYIKKNAESKKEIPCLS